jgi:hypothetical protein
VARRVICTQACSRDVLNDTSKATLAIFPEIVEGVDESLIPSPTVKFVGHSADS